ncbi:hypothetical protein HA402_007150 [Bradysia odoriphaga]|nr:hypothetical protein HA402_007150 [Bradysia odoriphaga]
MIRMENFGNVPISEMELNKSECGRESVKSSSFLLACCGQPITKEIEFRVPAGRQAIIGIKHIDWSQHPVQTEITDGGIGRNYVTIEITSQAGHGIESSFIFYANPTVSYQSCN